MQKPNKDNRGLAFLLRAVAAAYLLKSANRFKIIAYENAADTVEHLTRELSEIWQEDPTKKIPGIGTSIQSHLLEYLKTGKSSHFEEVFADIPPSVFILMSIPSIGPKTAYKLVKELKLENENSVITDLKKAAMEGRIATLQSFGIKSESEILRAVDLFLNNRNQKERIPLGSIEHIVAEIVSYLKAFPAVKQLDVMGSYRRKVSTIGDIDLAIIAETKDIQSIINHFINYPGKLSVDNAGDRKASIIVTPNVRVDLRIQEANTYGSMLQYFTGNKAHNVKLREYALNMGYSLSEYGIKPLSKEVPKKGSFYNSTTGLYEFDNEEKFYSFIGLQYIPPEIREGTDEIKLAAKKMLPKLVQYEDIKGDLHTHSSYDIRTSHDVGVNTYEEMIKKAEQLGYEYIGFADHNPKVSGQSTEDVIRILKERKEYLDQIIRTYKFEQIKVLVGLEVDILPTGDLSLPIEAMEYVDYLVVSVHSSFKLGIREMTARILKALSFPKVRIFGHPTGRMFGRRAGFELEWPKVFDLCKERNIALEINASPNRLDLPDSLVHEGLKSGCKFIIDTDSHAAEDLGKYELGISVARRGWATKSDIMNTLPYQQFKEWIDYKS